MKNNYLSRQIAEISSSNGLKLYGFFLSLTHIWTFIYWFRGNFFINAQSASNSEPLCFPFLPNCDLLRQTLSPFDWQLILYSYLALAILTAVAFTLPKRATLPYGLFLTLTLLKLVLHLSNYNFMGNYHYMIHWISFVFLFIPHKELAVRYSLVAFYFFAGTLKLNIDWLSGAAMIAPPWLSGAMLVASLFYVLVLELVFAFGLLSENKVWRRLCLAQFFAFHAFSWHIVGFYYPLVMFSLLSLLIWQELPENSPGRIPNLLKAPLTIKTIMALFTLLQLLPFTMAKDPSLSGAARLSSLNMFDAKTECHPLLVVHKNGEVIHLDRPLKQLGVRLACDPIVYLNQAHQLCRLNKVTANFDRLSLSLFSKRITQTEYQKVLEVQDVCQLSNPLWAELAEASQ